MKQNIQVISRFRFGKSLLTRHWKFECHRLLCLEFGPCKLWRLQKNVNKHCSANVELYCDYMHPKTPQDLDNVSYTSTHNFLAYQSNNILTHIMKQTHCELYFHGS